MARTTVMVLSVTEITMGVRISWRFERELRSRIRIGCMTEGRERRRWSEDGETQCSEIASLMYRKMEPMLVDVMSKSGWM